MTTLSDGDVAGLRTPLTNPFVPGSDAIPAVWAGRAALLSDWRDVVRPRRVAGLYERGRAFLGEPGIGKSVLANRIAQEAQAAGDIVVPAVRVPLGADAVGLLARALLETVDEHAFAGTIARRASGLLERVRAVSTPVGGVELDRPQPRWEHTMLTDALVEIARVARERDSCVVVRIDEVQNVTQRGVLSRLLVGIGDALSHNEPVTDVAGVAHDKTLPLAVYLSGLPEFTDRATGAAGATFARRFQPALLTHLDDDEVRSALASFTGPGFQVVTDDGPAAVVMTDDAVERIVGCCLGDPFLFQLVGNAAWTAGTGPVITAEHVDAGWAAVRAEASQHVEASLRRLPPLERSFLEVMAGLDPEDRTLSRIAAALHRTPAQLATTARRLEALRGTIRRGTRYTFVARAAAAYLAGRWP